MSDEYRLGRPSLQKCAQIHAQAGVTYDGTVCCIIMLDDVAAVQLSVEGLTSLLDQLTDRLTAMREREREREAEHGRKP